MLRVWATLLNYKSRRRANRWEPTLFFPTITKDPNSGHRGLLGLVRWLGRQADRQVQHILGFVAVISVVGNISPIQ